MSKSHEKPSFLQAEAPLKVLAAFSGDLAQHPQGRYVIFVPWRDLARWGTSHGRSRRRTASSGNLPTTT